MTLMYTGFVIIFSAALILYLIPHNGPWQMALPMAGITLGLGISRPLVNSLILEQVETDVGAASSMLMFTFFSLASIAMWLISQPWNDKIRVISIICLCTSITSIATLVIFQRHTTP